ncbi:MAG TPA: penicillin acylase family protein, partial [Pseudoxanthomonas sp.]|nr:penicillin acylase family protein [Pseudoxanthomonas sp.]
NNRAVSGALTADGRAIVADDMHLGRRAPNIWFRARLRYADPRAPRGRVDVAGLTLPGLPAVIVGSNGHVAWGFTNAYGDFADWALVEPCAAAPADAGRARDCGEITGHREWNAVAGREPVELRVRETRWGPVLAEQPDGRLLALRWVAHLPGSLQVSWADMAHAGGLDAALAIAARSAIPAQNLLLADRDGRIAWRLLATLPQRGAECTPRQPQALATGGAGCAPWTIDPARAPSLVDPSIGRLWTANNRVLDGEALAAVGDAGYAHGARAAQIRDALMARQRFDERALLQIQLDDRALFLARWWTLLQFEGKQAAGTALGELAQAAADWEGRAAPDSVSYRLVRAWRLAVHERIADGLVAPARAALGEDFETPAFTQLEGVAWPLLERRPRHLLPRRFGSWQALLQDAAREVRNELAAAGPLQRRIWGERNTAAICHPLAGALPGPIKRALCMPAQPLPGDTAMPRVQGPAFGASQRMVVSPGHEADGIAHMPGGQSGHPLSPFWGAGHDDWVQGRASPFLPGEARYSMRLKP